MKGKESAQRDKPLHGSRGEAPSLFYLFNKSDKGPEGFSHATTTTYIK